jgi:acyl-CoA hydrolase
MDLAAGNVAARRAHGRCATVAVESMAFYSPVFVGGGEPVRRRHRDGAELDPDQR